MQRLGGSRPHCNMPLYSHQVAALTSLRKQDWERAWISSQCVKAVLIEDGRAACLPQKNFGVAANRLAILLSSTTIILKSAKRTFEVWFVSRQRKLLTIGERLKSSCFCVLTLCAVDRINPLLPSSVARDQLPATVKLVYRLECVRHR